MPNKRVKNGDELGQLFVDRFEKLGVNARYFYRQNDARSTVIVYHIGHLLYHAKDEPVVDLQTAWNEAPNVIEQLKVVKEIQGVRKP